LKRATAVIAGNSYLQRYALQYNSRVHLIPTVLDLDRFRPGNRRDDSRVRLGWSGLEYNFKYLRILSPLLARLTSRFPVEVVILSGSPPADMPFPFRFVKWDPEREVDQIGEFDIGLMPLEDDAWCRGKCGMKLLQYMALAIPGVASAVGVNRDIVRQGENGFTATLPEEWEACITALIEDAALRRRLGAAARQTVELQYSVAAWFPRILEIYREYASGV
jgi:glycosyltransferase involved in cell wall biosynthesis